MLNKQSELIFKDELRCNAKKEATVKKIGEIASKLTVHSQHVVTTLGEFGVLLVSKNSVSVCLKFFC